MFNNCHSLSQAKLSGIVKSISYSNCRLSATALADIFDGLGTPTAGTAITITNNWGASLLTTTQRSIATDKGW
jgi:hypothetical protein